MFNIRRKKLDRIAAYQSLFATDDGKKVLYDLIRTHHILGTTFSKDQNETYLKEGERNVVLRIMSILNIDPERFLKEVDSGIAIEESYNE